jgi:uncharacterized membrane protein
MQSETDQAARPTTSSSANAFAGESTTKERCTPTDSARQFVHLLAEAKEYFAHLWAARIDRMIYAIRTAGIFGAVGVGGLIAACATVASAAVLLMVGTAWGLGILFNERYWLGCLVTGLVVLLALALAVYIALVKVTGAMRQTTVEKYERRKERQRGRFGRNVCEAAALRH